MRLKNKVKTNQACVLLITCINSTTDATVRVKNGEIDFCYIA